MTTADITERMVLKKLESLLNHLFHPHHKKEWKEYAEDSTKSVLERYTGICEAIKEYE